MSSINITQDDKRTEEEHGCYQNSKEQKPTSSDISRHLNAKVNTALPRHSLDNKHLAISLKNKTHSLGYLNKTIRSSKSLNDLTNIKDRCNLFSDNTDLSTNVVRHTPKTFRSSSLSSLDTTFHKHRKEFEDETRFDIIKTHQTEVLTRTNITINNPDNRIIIVRSDFARQPPPSYEYTTRPQSYSYLGMAGHTPVYRTPNLGYTMYTSRDAGQIPTFGRGDINVGFDTREIRNKFIRKVYLLLAIQILFTFGFITFCLYEKNTREFVKHQWGLLILTTIGLLSLIITLLCCEKARRSYPLNLILLALMTLCIAYGMAATSCHYETNVVMITMGVTGGILALISLLAWLPWFDITRWIFLLFIALLIVFGYGFVMSIIALITNLSILNLIYPCLLTLVFCMYFIFDTQRILGGRSIEMSPEEYILGAITLYIDIIIIFGNLVFLSNHCK